MDKDGNEISDDEMITIYDNEGKFDFDKTWEARDNAGQYFKDRLIRIGDARVDFVGELAKRIERLGIKL